MSDWELQQSPKPVLAYSYPALVRISAYTKCTIIISRVRPFHDIKVWGGRFKDLKKNSCSTDTLRSLL